MYARRGKRSLQAAGVTPILEPSGKEGVGLSAPAGATTVPTHRRTAPPGPPDRAADRAGRGAGHRVSLLAVQWGGAHASGDSRQKNVEGIEAEDCPDPNEGRMPQTLPRTSWSDRSGPKRTRAASLRPAVPQAHHCTALSVPERREDPPAGHATSSTGRHVRALPAALPGLLRASAGRDA